MISFEADFNVNAPSKNCIVVEVDTPFGNVLDQIHREEAIAILNNLGEQCDKLGWFDD